MDPHDVEILAKTLISEFAPEYHFGWNNLKTVFGRCVYATKTIELSRHLTPLRPNKAIMQTIMHEIAHAMHKGDGHGSKWKAQMRAFGFPPDRCSPDVVDRSSISNWRAQCWNCGKVSYFVRKPRLQRSCGKCGNGVYNPKYEMKFVRMS